MTHIGTILILLAPAILATGFHVRLMPLPEKRTPLALFGLAVLYAFAIAYLLSCAKFVRGKAATRWRIASIRSKTLSSTARSPWYSARGVTFCARLSAAFAGAASFARRILGSRLFARRAQRPCPCPMCPPPSNGRMRPRPGRRQRPRSAARKAASDEVRTRRTEALLAAQEAEMVAAHARVVPRRKADGAPSQTPLTSARATQTR